MSTSSTDPRDAPFSLDALGIAPAQLEPFLAPVALPNPTAERSTLDAGVPQRRSLSLSNNALSEALTSTPRSFSIPADVAGSRTTATPQTPVSLDSTALAKRLEPFMADSPPIARSMPLASAPVSALASPSPSPSPFVDRPRTAANALPSDDPFTAPFSSARPSSLDSPSLGPSSQPNIVGSTWDGSSSSGDTSRIEARLTRAIDRLEQIAQQLEPAGGLNRGAPARSFRGRIDD